ncbi:uracil-DNA glycosylase family protein [Bradyrhizobium acaciae]|uniref:uracil-DNA glycosylase family protein n=1 Tax=Bradyrhizobium acaciae TaxID=2683706 RepID=UPI001E5EDD0F|nr:uracil-DNA glycosylase family protein [Bradyrhizobium acaciae]MCC8978565.1 hypothetical protein [Bradyrhizobium acaciae]
MRRKTSVLFLGPCRKFDPATDKPFPAFSPSSRSGKFLRGAIEAAGLPKTVSISFDNVIPRALFDKQGRERYPSCAELVDELERHELWRLGDSDVVIGLSSIVGDALIRVKNTRSAAGEKSGPRLVRLEHPSFIMRRPLRERTDYIKRLGDCIDSMARRASMARSAAT